jgi:hypothetical protein
LLAPKEIADAGFRVVSAVTALRRQLIDALVDEELRSKLLDAVDSRLDEYSAAVQRDLGLEQSRSTVSEP